MATEGGDMDDWKPPTEAEMKVLNARRERQDKISQLMGQYLLKGYKMLGSVCSLCGTILMQDKQGVDYCIACKELSSDVDKDNPAMSDEAAASQVRERSSLLTTEHSIDADSGLHYVDLEPRIAQAAGDKRPLDNISSAASRLLTRLQHGAGDDFEVAPLPCASISGLPSFNQRSKLMSETSAVLESRIQWANSQLRKATNSEQIIALCDVIQKCVNTLKTIESLS